MKEKWMPVRSLGVFSLVMINLTIIAGIKNWPMAAGFGLSSVFYFFLASALVLLPCALVVAELSSTFSGPGGIYLWIKEAFGHRVGFTATWLMFIEGLVWIPLPLTMIATALEKLWNVSPANMDFFELISVLVLIWGSTFLALRGVTLSAIVTVFATVIGLVLPGILIIILGVVWIFDGQPIQMSFSWTTFSSEISDMSNWVIFSSLLFAITGLEASSFLEENVREPKRSFRKAAFLSTACAFVLMLLGSLAISIVLPDERITLFVGTLDALNSFLIAYNLKGLYSLGVVLITFGVFASMNAWVVIPLKGIHRVAMNGDLPYVFRLTNQHGAPATLLIFQALVVSVLASLIVLFPNITEMWWIFMALAAILYQLVYLFFFAAAIKLRYKRPDVVRPFKIPGGNFGMWLVAGAGFLVSLAVFAISFLLPSYTLNFDQMNYFPWFALALVIIVFFPNLILLFKKKSWTHPLKLDDEAEKKSQ